MHHGFKENGSNREKNIGFFWGLGWRALTTAVLMKGVCCSSSHPRVLPHFRSIYLYLIVHPLLVKRSREQLSLM